MTVLLPHLAPFAWALLAFAALLVGVSKTALPSVNTISIAILPAKASTGAAGAVDRGRSLRPGDLSQAR